MKCRSSRCTGLPLGSRTRVGVAEDLIEMMFLVAHVILRDEFQRRGFAIAHVAGMPESLRIDVRNDMREVRVEAVPEFDLFRPGDRLIVLGRHPVILRVLEIADIGAFLHSDDPLVVVRRGVGHMPEDLFHGPFVSDRFFSRFLFRDGKETRPGIIDKLTEPLRYIHHGERLSLRISIRFRAFRVALWKPDPELPQLHDADGRTNPPEAACTRAESLPEV